MNLKYKIFALDLMIVSLNFSLSGCQQSDHNGKAWKANMSGMDMSQHNKGTQGLNLSVQLNPTNGFAVSSIPTSTLSMSEVSPEITALGRLEYDTRQEGVISAKASGRIEKLYVRYRYQKIRKGDKVMDIYSPELLTTEENLLFLLKNDSSNNTLINSTKERLVLLGMSTGQIQNVIQSRRALYAITIFSNYSGSIQETGTGTGKMGGNAMPVTDIGLTTEPLSVKEGMYVQKGQNVFNVYNAGKAWVLLNIYTDDQDAIALGDSVSIIFETLPGKGFSGKIDFIEPFYRKDNKTLAVRVYFDNSALHLPIGSQAKATMIIAEKTVATLPATAVVSLGADKIVFRKVTGGFIAQKVETGNTYGSKIQILGGLSVRDSVADNGQFLMDSESFIKVND
jgi:membrane fusion protein, copper/silver efflux system